ncbi:serine/threonine-protein kinase [Kitasatospora sp. NPDC057015]|uniref:serine/threonine-protein kinase n=1 Tax=Kitasatospora sp. NPDC057015 TaxID=3346001 RepID=UPI0036292411
MEALDAADPRQIGEYRLLRRLGAGGMGQVYLGRTAGGRTVAVKTVHREFAADHEFRVRFRQEVSAARRVGGRWTAPVLDADTESERPWVATAYVAGPSLTAAVREFGPLPATALRVLGAGLAEALAAVHGLGLVHRDVKPSNVLLALDGPRLIDFGITRSLDAATALTRSGFVIGSPGYLSPEQAQGLPSGPAGDVFSLGAVLAFAATGSAPFGEGLSTPALLYRVVHEDPDLDRLASHEPELRALIAACLAKDPASRPTPDQVREALTTAGGGPASAPGAGPGGAGRLGGDWLPPAVAGALARLAVELLDLDAATGAVAGEPAASSGSGSRYAPVGGAASGAPPAPAGAAPGAPTGRFGPPLPWVAPAPPAAGPPGRAPTAAATALPGPPAHGYPGADGHPGASTPPGAPVGREARRRRGLVTAAVLAVAAAGLTTWLVQGWGSDQGGRGSANPGADGAASPTAAHTSPGAEPTAATSGPVGTPSDTAAPPPGGQVPAGYLGTWAGILTTPALPLQADFRITIGQGEKDGPVATIHNNTGAGTPYCDSTALLISAEAQRLVLKTSPTTGLSGCVANPALQVYTRNTDGSLHLEVDGFTGDLAPRR